MGKSIKAIAMTSTLVAGLAAAPVLHADDSNRSGGAMKGSGMMGQKSEMMESCNRMMQSMNRGQSGKPNGQWRKDTPETDKRPGTNR